jgi:hypothetical protein
MHRVCSLVSPLLLLAALTMPVVGNAQIICVSNTSPPPELPVYEQPPIPAPGYMWIPGYWASGPNGYFWVPGTWVQPPAVRLLWTPGYWVWRDGVYLWNAGYWGPHIGFYGGVNYGFGYVGVGFEGGRWENGAFAYNRAITNLGRLTITNVYEKRVVIEPGPRPSFNGGSGGTTAKPTPEEEAAAHEQHVAAVPAQFQHERTASANKALLASENHGKPAIAATAKPNEFTGKGVVAAKEEKPNAVKEEREGKPNAGLPATKPTGAAAVGTVNPNALKTPEKKTPTEKNRATINGPTPLNPNTEMKPATVDTKLRNKETNRAKTNEKRANREAKPAITGEPQPKATNAKPESKMVTAPKQHPGGPQPKAKPKENEKP